MGASFATSSNRCITLLVVLGGTRNDVAGGIFNISILCFKSNLKFEKLLHALIAHLKFP